MRPPRPSLATDDSANVDRISQAHAAMVAADDDSSDEGGEAQALQQLEQGLQQANAALAALKSSHQQPAVATADADTGSPSAQGAA